MSAFDKLTRKLEAEIAMATIGLQNEVDWIAKLTDDFKRAPQHHLSLGANLATAAANVSRASAALASLQKNLDTVRGMREMGEL